MKPMTREDNFYFLFFALIALFFGCAVLCCDASVLSRWAGICSCSFGGDARRFDCRHQQEEQIQSYMVWCVTDCSRHLLWYVVFRAFRSVYFDARCVIGVLVFTYILGAKAGGVNQVGHDKPHHRFDLYLSATRACVGGDLLVGVGVFPKLFHRIRSKTLAVELV